MMLRWAEVVPIWFLQQSPELATTSFVILSPSSSSERSSLSPSKIDENLEIGRSLRKFIDLIDERVAVVVSGDLAHTHLVESDFDEKYLSTLPVSETATTFDFLIKRWIESLDPHFLLQESALIVGKALCCGFDGFVILQGMLGQDQDVLRQYNSQVIHYSAPTYYGMIVAVVSIKYIIHKVQEQSFFSTIQT